MAKMKTQHKLIDRFGRVINYLRISVTDRCDFRCVYCMDEQPSFVRRAKLLTLKELSSVAHAATELGITKIRVTGGEPLMRRNIVTLLNNIGRLKNLKELALTTNGSRLLSFSEQLKDAGVKRINISLDSLDAEKFRCITRTGNLQKVLLGIQHAIDTGFDGIKLNAVILKNRNHDEIIDLVEFALAKGIDISFIEEMPLGVIGDHDRAEAYYSSDRIRADIEQRFSLQESDDSTGGPSKYFHILGTNTRVGFISPHSHNFCGQCNRIRLSCEGRLLLCLGQEHSVDLRHIIRSYPGDMGKLKQAIRDAINIKPQGHDFNLHGKTVILRHMNTIGG